MISNINIVSDLQLVYEYFAMINSRESNDFVPLQIIQGIKMIIEINLIPPQKMLFSYIDFHQFFYFDSSFMKASNHKIHLN